MDPLTLALIAATGVAKAGAGIAQGVGTARAAKGMMLTPEQEEELAAIERGDGLSDRRRGALEARFLQQQAGAQRQLEAAGLQQNVVLEQARAEGLAKADAMRLQQQQAEAQRRAGITQAVSLGLSGAADVAGQALAAQQQVAMAEAQAGLQDTEALLNQLEDTAATQGFTLMQGI